MDLARSGGVQQCLPARRCLRRCTRLQTQVREDPVDGGLLQGWRRWISVRREAASRERRQMAASVSTRRRQKADFRRDGPAGQSQLAATPGETRSRPWDCSNSAVRSSPSGDRGNVRHGHTNAAWTHIAIIRTAASGARGRPPAACSILPKADCHDEQPVHHGRQRCRAYLYAIAPARTTALGVRGASLTQLLGADRLQTSS